MTNDTVSIRLHPEALFDEDTREVALDLTPYRAWGEFVSARKNEYATANGERLRVTSHGDGLLRLRWLPGGAKDEPTVTERLGLVHVPGTNGPVGLSCAVDCATGGVRVTDESGAVLLDGGMRFAVEPGEFSGYRSVGTFRLDPDERIFGFGGRIMRPDRTGLFADLYSVKAGHHSGDYGGFPVPFFLSTKGYGVFVNNPWPHLYFDMGRTNPGEWFVHAPGGDCDLFVVRGPEFADMLRRFTDLVGRLPSPRRWWMGLWGGSLSLARVSEILDTARKFRAENLPCDAIQIDGTWRGGPEFLKRYMIEGAYTSNDFEWHPEFGDGKAMVDELRRLKIRTVLHINSRSFRADTAERGVREGWLRRQGNETVVRVGDSSAEKTYHKLLAGRVGEGIGCWLQDHGDRLGGEVLPGIPSRNLFGALWARATTDACPAAGDPDKIVFTRGCGIGGQRHAIIWSGDTRFGVDFFKEDLWFLINAGLAGFPLASADLGGFYSADGCSAPHNRAYDRDNLARRVVQSLFFMPTPRTQDDAREPPKFPWNCPPDIARLYADMLRLRYRMIPYHYSYLVHAHRTGEPIIRHLVHHHRRDPMARDVHDQIYLGDWLLIAPVIEKGARSRAVYLPSGIWFDFWTGERHEGPITIRVETPLCELRGLPVFVKAGAILPTQDDVLALADDPPAVLTLDIFPHGESRFDLHESPTLAHEFRCVAAGGEVTVTLPNHLPHERTYRVRVRGVSDEQVVVVQAGLTGQVTVTAQD